MIGPLFLCLYPNNYLHFLIIVVKYLKTHFIDLFFRIKKKNTKYQRKRVRIIF